MIQDRYTVEQHFLRYEMVQRREPRTPAGLQIQVWGRDANGKPFVQSARTVNVSKQGAMIENIACKLRVGEIIRIQCGDQKANFEVEWVGSPETDNAGRIGVKTLVQDRYIWTVETQPPGTDLDSVPVRSRAVRARGRNANLKVELRAGAGGIPTWGTISDMGLHHCFINILDPPAVDTPVQLTIWLGSDKILAKAIVRGRRPGIGFEVEFTHMAETDYRVLQKHLN